MKILKVEDVLHFNTLNFVYKSINKLQYPRHYFVILIRYFEGAVIIVFVAI